VAEAQSLIGIGVGVGGTASGRGLLLMSAMVRDSVMYGSWEMMVL
jgi:hypothetical protein